MDGNRFDDISKAIAGRSTRRQALRQVGSGGVLAGLASVVGLGRVRALAQDDDLAAGDTCTMQFSAETAVGPDKSTAYSGTIDLQFTSTGAIDTGVFHSDDGNDYDLVGQVVGRAVNLLISFDNSDSIALSGTAKMDATLCKADIGGTFSGPQSRDIGTWFATKAPNSTSSGGTSIIGGSSSGGSTSGGSTSGGNTSGGSSSSGGDTSGGGSTDNGPTPTPCPAIDCGSTFVLNPDTCECGCPDPYEKCGDTMCCYAGSVCNPDVSCLCPDGTEPCNNVCTTSCASGTHFDDSCQCVAETSLRLGRDPLQRCLRFARLQRQPALRYDELWVRRPLQSRARFLRWQLHRHRQRPQQLRALRERVPNRSTLYCGTCECPATTTYDSTKMMCV